jgi:hypothetical protein
VGSAADVGKPAARKADTADEDAYDLYLKGHSLFVARTRYNLGEAARIMRAAVAKDPKFARAWASAVSDRRAGNCVCMTACMLIVGASLNQGNPRWSQM